MALSGSAIKSLVRLSPFEGTLAKLTNHSIRFASGRSGCIENPFPECGKEQLQKNKKDCLENPAPKNGSPFKSMWENPECCLDPCAEALPRFDQLYYKITDKAKARYHQTWVECPLLKIEKRKICCYDQIKLPPIERRKFPRCAKKSCPPPDKMLMLCKQVTASKCSRVILPRCRGVRLPPSCFKNRYPKICGKVCAPYPSFSECDRPRPKPRRPTECKCLEIPMWCEVYEYLRKMDHH